MRKSGIINRRKVSETISGVLYCQDATRVADFYSAAFGWQTQALGPTMSNYVVANTCETADGRPTQPGTINGGFFEKTPDNPAQQPSVVIAVDNLQAAIAKVISAGGTVLGEPMNIPGIGTYASFLDTEGNRVAMLQALPRS